MIDTNLTPQQKDEVAAVLHKSLLIFSKAPGLTHLAVHQILTPEGTVVRSRW